MQQQFILFIIILKYLLIKSEESSLFYRSITLKFYYSYEKPSRSGQIQVTTRLVPKANVISFYVLIGDFIDYKTLVIRAINCTTYRSTRQHCGAPFESQYMFISNEQLIEDHVLKIESEILRFKKILNELFQKSLDRNTFNLTCVFVDVENIHIEKPKGPHDSPLSKTSLFGIIFLSSCIVLVFILCFGWFGVIYSRRYRQYRMKKKHRQELAQSVQQMLDKSPVIIYDSTKREDDQTDDEPMCAICLELFKTKEKLRKLVCSHYFHITCIDPWLLSHQSCPLCNRNILRNSIPSISSSIMAVINERNNDESTSIAHNENNQTI